MPIMPDHWMRRMATEQGMIEPFVERQQRRGVISYGLSPYGVRRRVAGEFKIFTNVDNALVDPKNFPEAGFVSREGDVCIVPPNSFALAHTTEYFRIPRDVLVICLGKSTYARFSEPSTEAVCVTGDAPRAFSGTSGLTMMAHRRAHSTTAACAPACC